MDEVKLEELIRLRREFHKCAEAGWLEFETTIRIVDYLKKLGLEVRYGKDIHSRRQGLPTQEEIHRHGESLGCLEYDFDTSEILQGYTGAVGILDSGISGPTIALRFDIDANDIEEAAEEHRPVREGFASKNKGMMHACGHDGHIAIGLATARFLSSRKKELKGKIIFVFQPAEEGVRGAKSLVDNGILESVNHILAGHIGFMGKENEILCGVGGFLATNKLDVYYHGKAAHAGAYPEKGKNALLAGANCAINLHTLTQYSSGTGRINVGTFRSGSARNIVAAEAKLELETRGETEEINEHLRKRAYEVIEASARMYDVDYEIVEVGSAPAYSFERNVFSEKVHGILQQQGFNVMEGASLGASEDISHMFREVEQQGGSALYFVFGTRLEAPHHDPCFDFDEKVLENGFRCYSGIALNLLRRDDFCQD